MRFPVAVAAEDVLHPKLEARREGGQAGLTVESIQKVDIQNDTHVTCLTLRKFVQYKGSDWETTRTLSNAENGFSSSIVLPSANKGKLLLRSYASSGTSIY